MWPLVVAALVGPASGTTSADPIAAPAVQATRVVVLVPRSSDRRVDDVVASVRAAVLPEQVELVLVPQADEGATRIAQAQRAADDYDASGVFWLDLRDASAYSVYLWLPEKGTLLRRRVTESAQSVEAAIEAMAIIVRSGTLALASGRDVAMEAIDPAVLEEKPVEPTVVVPTQPIEPPPPKPAPPPKERRLWLSFGYEGLGLGRAMPWQSGGAIELSFAVHRFVKLGGAYAVVGGAKVRSPAELSILRHEIAAVLGIGGAVHPRVRIEARLLPALELVQWRAPAQDRRGVRATPKLAVELALRIHLAPRLTLDVGPGADVALTSSPFVLCEATAGACTGADRQVVLTPWRVRPRARAGLSVLF
ncbi:MAG TPA: hypothetical protein VG755_36100 [Nannocystaceae bacterium]|nr:hypothetical protein [Nannocystaceae bacterium]